MKAMIGHKPAKIAFLILKIHLRKSHTQIRYITPIQRGTK